MQEYKETWKALDLYKIAVSDKGHIRVNGEILSCCPPDRSHKRSYFKFRNPLTNREITRDAATIVWRAFKGRVNTSDVITYIDGDVNNVSLENLKWENRQHAEHRKNTMTPEEMRARVPMIIENMVKMWGVNKG